MGALFSSPKKPKTVEPPAIDKSGVQKADADARRRASLARGRASTILAQPGGLGTVG